MDFSNSLEGQKTAEAASLLLKLNEREYEDNVLQKLLYIADRMALQKWERPITYAKYRVESRAFGITSNLVQGRLLTFQGMNDKDNTNLVNPQIPIKKLSRAEIEILKEVYSIYGKRSFSELTDILNSYPEFKNRKGTSFTIALEEVFKAIGYDSIEIKRVMSEILDEERITALFN